MMSGDQSDLSSEWSMPACPADAPSECAGAVQIWETQYKDIQTGAPISSARVAEINAAIDKLQADLKQGKKVYRQVLQAGGTKKAAEQASNEAAGGKFTILFDNLCLENILVSMQVKLSPSFCQPIHE